VSILLRTVREQLGDRRVEAFLAGIALAKNSKQCLEVFVQPSSFQFRHIPSSCLSRIYNTMRSERETKNGLILRIRACAALRIG